MENTKAKTVVITVLVILLILSLGFIVYQNFIKKENINNISNNTANSVEPTNNLTDFTINGLEDKWYTGHEINQNIEIKNNNEILQEGVDYTIEYLNNVKPGEATIIISGIGKYTGDIQKKFNIKDQYEKYSFIKKWASDSDVSNQLVEAKIYIKDNKVFYSEQGDIVEIKGLKGNPKKVCMYWDEATVEAYAITSNNELFEAVFGRTYDEENTYFKAVAKNVLDIAPNAGEVGLNGYYLTIDGQLLSLREKYNETYEKINANYNNE